MGPINDTAADEIDETGVQILLTWFFEDGPHTDIVDVPMPINGTDDVDDEAA